ncbi:MAG: ribonuclease HIII [Armatimonadetes bacterium]|nr:ribonuclease HIII [Armatimonadota bacterium]NIM23063.1 ribonuclease HIII [Armatimonadota bacterium]NIM66931.1 ribonuclease HIII [Armatimonadota bacterium]NIM75465.1 ribonuclease HIII [Armatimonadota bacterium]NIN05122.1 ribonuclease HIII [Armatimonadota bacterium]
MKRPQPAGKAEPGRIGTDEAGKGDYFGPLVVAAVWADEEMEEILRAQNVRDSKRVSDGICHRLAKEVAGLCPNQVVKIFPQKYNLLISTMKNLNRLLGWAHARAIESLLEELESRLPNRKGTLTVVADRFGDEAFLEQALMKKGRKATLQQRVKAEEETVVAAASLLARAGFLQGLERLSKECGITLPKGASNVLSAGRQVAAKGGEALLNKVAKTHFKTTKQIITPKKN